MQRLYPTSKAHGPPMEIYDDLAFPDPPADRPYVVLNMVSTVDGKTTLEKGAITEPIGSPVDRALMAHLRLAVDAVIRGAATVRRSGCYPGVPEELEHRRVARGLPRQPLAIVVSRTGEIPVDVDFFRAAPRRPLVLLPENVEARRLGPLRERAHLLHVGQDQVDLPAALRMLRSQFGVNHLLSEGGPRFNYELLRHGMLNEVFWTVAPKIGGNSGDLTLVHGPAGLVPMPTLQLMSAYAKDSELFLRYKVKDERSARRE